ncbi:MAG: glycoside hydrolase family 3 C-terminal domain-containing protein [Clostridia bacterium]|nr:glycoside hydrolase family 3 C-terminal domain-containing protein [Clostridia bacterium]
MSKRAKLWSGLTAITASLLGVVVVGTGIANSYADVINDALNVQTSQTIHKENAENEDTVYFKSSFGEFNAANLEKLKQATKEQAMNEMREGAALLYNEKQALPLKGKKVSLFGRATYTPVYQGSSAGNKINAKTAEKSDYKGALEKEGFQVNETIYNALATLPDANTKGDNGSNGNRVVGSGAGEGDKAFYEARMNEVGDYTDAAIVMLSRTGAEGTDLKMDDIDDDGVSTLSALALHQNEREMLKLVREKFGKVIVLLNSANQMEVEEIKEYADAILYIGFPGQYGFTGVAEILSGKVNPSGHIVDTYAVDSLSAPACVNSGTRTPTFTNADEINEKIGSAENASWISFQAESIYLGYRYYETRYEDSVLKQGNATASAGARAGQSAWSYANEVSYPFGYGLSYTSFEQKLDKVEVRDDTVEVTVTVKNTGSVPGKSVVQVYAQTPYGDYEKKNKVEKSAIEIVDFTKTKELAAGASETVTVSVDKYLLASYDSIGEKGYILSGGDYYISIGDDVHDALNNMLAAKGKKTSDGMTASGNADKAYKFTQSFDANKYRMSTSGVRVTNQFTDCDLNTWIEGAGTYLSRSDWKNTYPVSQTTVRATDEMLDYLDGDTYVKPADAPSYDSVASQFGKDSGLTLAMMKDVPITDKAMWRKFILQISIDELPFATAEGFTCPAVGILSPAFKVADGCDSNMGTVYIYPKSGTTKPAKDADGKDLETTKDEGVIQYKGLRYCSKPILTGTFNRELYAGRGKLMGEESTWANLMENYNTGADLHRTPFGGRSFEYMSECPTMSYLASIPEVEAMEKTGTHAAPKHFCGNDQETHREGVCTFFNEQAMRQGALRAFEGALKVAKAGGLMQSFERLGCTWASASYAMNTAVLRKEWGWTGNIVTDAASSMKEMNVGYKHHPCEVIAAGTEQFCLDGKGTHGKGVLEYAKNTDDGYLVECMINAAISWEYAIATSVLVNGMSASDIIVPVTPWWSIALTAATVTLSVLTAAAFVLLIVDKVKG